MTDPKQNMPPQDKDTAPASSATNKLSWPYLIEYGQRAELLGELHARPFEPIDIPRRIIHLAFLTNDVEAGEDRNAINTLCTAHGIAPPTSDSNYHRMTIGPWNFRWEQHTEFTSYRWDKLEENENNFSHTNIADLLKEISFRQPGRLIVANQLSLSNKKNSDQRLAQIFDPSSLCVIDAEHGLARVATDFHTDTKGFTHILIEDYGMSSIRSGMLAQRIVELETYRTLALMGLPLARQSLPLIQQGENQLATLTRNISEATTIETNHKLLEQLTNLAAKLEAQSAATSFRFSASNAYYDIVKNRLDAVHENRIEGHRRFSSFFQRRLAPAIATCQSVQKRQNDLSRKLIRTAELLRTRIQFELEQQNRDLLKSMNRRAKVQLRLQQTVEGLSVAAVSYYIAGLISYIAKGLEKSDLTYGLSSTLITATAIPLIVLLVWLLVRGVHRKFSDHD